MNKYLAVVALLSSCSAIFLTEYTDCGSHGIIHSIQLEPCNQEPCIIHKGVSYTTHINFTAKEHSDKLSNVCHGIIAGAPIPFAVYPLNACGNGVKCPLEPGDAEIYTATVTCPTNVSTMRLAGKWEVVDQNGLDLICFVVGLKIVD
ncbi:Phosphatidylglycerol/phosphatidylinositol transfer protein [Mactra antiquata]